MKPYFSNGTETIYLGDCEQVFPEITKVDLTVTSPPYNQIDPKTMRKPSGMRRNTSAGLGWHRTVTAHGYDDDMPETDYQKWIHRIIKQCLVLTDGLVWVNHKTRFRNKKAIHPLSFLDFPLYSEIIWDRGGSLTLNARKFAPSHEYIFGFGEPKYWDNKYNTKMSVWRMSKIGQGAHPCAFPLTLPLLLIGSSCPIGGIVLDPFMGSGTTLRAAKMIKRKSIGIEKREDYCEFAANRLLVK